MSRATEEFWRGAFGDAYLERCRVDWKARIPFWDQMLRLTDAQSVLEVGCNAAWNLRAIRDVADQICICGLDVNETAIKEAREDGFTAWVQSGGDSFGKSNFDLVFTVGVLIHLSSEGPLQDVMMNIVEASRRYVIAIEYADEKEVEVEYRGHSGKLWRRPFGKLYKDMGLKMVETGRLTKEEGFDNTTYWLLKKTS